jgi:hypothetical protein
MILPDKPAVEILGTTVAGRNNPEGFGIPGPARTLAID